VVVGALELLGLAVRQIVMPPPLEILALAVLVLHPLFLEQ
jgi:hypothetical protein